MRALSLLLAALLIAAPIAAQRPSDERRPSIEEMRKRWEEKTPAERELLRQRFEALKQMRPEERERLEERSRKFESIERRVREHAPQRERDEAEHLPPPGVEKFWRERALERTRELGRDLRERLPEHVVERLSKASPDERRAMLQRLRTEGRDRLRKHALRDMGRWLGLSDEKVAELEALPPDERDRMILALKRDEVIRRVDAEDELPKGLTIEEWTRLKTLPADEFLREMRTNRCEARWKGRGDDGPHRRPFDRDRWQERDGRDGPPPPPRDRDGEGDVDGRDRERRPWRDADPKRPGDTPRRRDRSPGR